MMLDFIMTVAHGRIELQTHKSATQRCLIVAMQFGTKKYLFKNGGCY